MSKFDDDMARGCLPTGEPLECLYGVGWWTEIPEEEPEPDPVDLQYAELENRFAELTKIADRLADIGDGLTCNPKLKDAAGRTYEERERDWIKAYDDWKEFKEREK